MPLNPWQDSQDTGQDNYQGRNQSDQGSQGNQGNQVPGSRQGDQLTGAPDFQGSIYPNSSQQPTGTPSPAGMSSPGGMPSNTPADTGVHFVPAIESMKGGSSKAGGRHDRNSGRDRKKKASHDGNAGRRTGRGQDAGYGNGAGPAGPGGVGSDMVAISKKRLAVIIALVIIVVVLATILIMEIASCNRSDTLDTGSIDATSGAWVDPYDWDLMKNDEDGLLAYYDENGNKLSEEGIDVSEHDGTIDWQQVKNAGVDFAIIRVGYRGYTQGSIVLDEQFYNNITGAYNAGLKVGVYFFSQAISTDEAVEEANFVLDCLENVNVTLSYPIAFDEELHPGGSDTAARTDNLTTQELTDNAIAYLSTITAAGYEGMIYGNQNDLARLDLTGELAQYPIWYAEYGVDHPTGQYDMAIWQYKETGIIAGTSENEGATDLNIRFIASDSW